VDSGPGRPCSLIWPCSRWGLPSQPVTRLLVGSYPAISPLPGVVDGGRWTVDGEKARRGASCRSSSCLLTVHRPPSTVHHPRRYPFCCTFPVLRQPESRLGRWALPTTAPCGARTFLSPRRWRSGQRPSGRPANLSLIIKDGSTTSPPRQDGGRGL